MFTGLEILHNFMGLLSCVGSLPGYPSSPYAARKPLDAIGGGKVLGFQSLIQYQSAILIDWVT